jgi:hypothetical protein
MKLGIDQIVDVILGGETRQPFLAMSNHAPQQVACDADIKRTILSACEDIDRVLSVALHSSTLPPAIEKPKTCGC